MSEKLLVSAYLNIGNIWHHDAKVIGTCWGFQLVHNITEQIAMNNPNKSLPMVMLDDANAALAAKDARIVELEGMLAKALAFTEANTFGGTDALELIEECHAALASKQQAEPTMAKNANVAATHSEDGRDICAAGDLRGEFLGCSFSQYRMERGIKLSLDDGVLSILLTDDQPARQPVEDGREAIKEAQELGLMSIRPELGDLEKKAETGKIIAQIKSIHSEENAFAQNDQAAAEVVPCYTPSGKRVALNSEHQNLPIGTKLYTQPARQVGVDDIACDRAYRNGLISGFNHGINSDEDSFNRSLNAYQREIHQATAELRDAIAPAASKVNSGCYVQDVPEHCDRITWRGHYYGLPPLAPVARQVGGGEPWRDEDLMLVPRALLGAVRYALKNKKDAPSLYDQLGEYCYGQAALAPAAVVMPGRKEVPAPNSWMRQGWAKGWNSACDEFSRLNRRAIPAGLLERVCAIAECEGQPEGDELRAMLDKGD